MYKDLNIKEKKSAFLLNLNGSSSNIIAYRYKVHTTSWAIEDAPITLYFRLQYGIDCKFVDSDQLQPTNYNLQPTTHEYSLSPKLASLMLFRKSVITRAWRRLEKSQNPRELTRILLSSKFSFRTKANWLMGMPMRAIKNIGYLRLLENDLENAGHFQLAQIIRWHIFWENTPNDRRRQQLEWSQRVIETDIEARWIVQRERYLQEEVQALQKSLKLPADDDKKKDMKALQSQMDTYEKELRCLNTEYSTYSRLKWQLEGDMPDGAIGRAFKAYRKDPDWYQCKWLRQDCAGRGGCCGRNCGCCENAREISKGSHHGWNQGHCTSACGCCIRTLGYPDGEMDRQKDIRDFPFDAVSYNTRYSGRIFRAYIFGLTFLDEFELIAFYE